MGSLLNKALFAGSILLLPATSIAQRTSIDHRRHHFAQSNHMWDHPRNPVYKRSGAEARTTTDNASRLISEVTSGYNGTAYEMLDSSVLNYTGQRGSYFDGYHVVWK